MSKPSDILTIAFEDIRLAYYGRASYAEDKDVLREIVGIVDAAIAKINESAALKREELGLEEWNSTFCVCGWNLKFNHMGRRYCSHCDYKEPKLIEDEVEFRRRMMNQ